MINFEDELAWLNHRLDEQLKIWRKKHQLHGRIFYLLANSFVIILLLCFGSGFLKNIHDAAWQSIFFTTLSILFFSGLARKLYTRLLKGGRSLKAKIHEARTSGKKEEQYQALIKFQAEFEELFRIELDFPKKEPSEKAAISSTQLAEMAGAASRPPWQWLEFFRGSKTE